MYRVVSTRGPLSGFALSLVPAKSVLIVDRLLPKQTNTLCGQSLLRERLDVASDESQVGIETEPFDTDLK
jgi:hypothetical protein